MLDYKNILRVASDPHKSMRTVELELPSFHHTIRKVLDAAEKARVNWPLVDSVTNKILIELHCIAGLVLDVYGCLGYIGPRPYFSQK